MFQLLGKIMKNIYLKETSILLIVTLTSIIFFAGESHAQTPQIPDQPIGFTATAISPTSIQLNWSPPQNNGGSPLTGYEVDYRIAPSSTYTSLATLSNVTTFTHTNLITGKTYIYRVSAINAIGKGNPSAEVVATPTSSSTPPKNIAPNPPQSLIATTYSSTQVNLSWTTPSSNGGPSITGYKIDYMIDSKNFTNLVSNSGSALTAYSHTGLLTGHTYTYRVFAINSIGTSNSSNTAAATTVQITTVPGSPNLSANPSSATSVSLSWIPPSNDGGSAIIGYKIEYSNATTPFTVLVTNTGNSQTTYNHKGLVTGQTYSYRVTALNSIGLGNPSNVATAQPQETKTPNITLAIPISPTKASLSWLPPSQTYGLIISGYRIDQVINGNFLAIDNTASSVTSYTIPNLITDKTYTFAVTALLSGGTQTNPSPLVSVTPTSSSSAPIPSSQPSSQNPTPTNQSLPDPPSVLNATMISQNAVKLTWAMPPNNGKPSIIGFKIETKTGPSGTWSTIISNTGVETSFIKSGLQSGPIYYYRISSINSIGTGQPSTEVYNSALNTNQIPPPITIPIQQSQGMIPVTNTTSTISYKVVGGQILVIGANPGTFSLNVNLKASTAGILSIQIPRDMLDAKKPDGSDEVFIVTDDKNIAEFNETKTSSYRTLSIAFPANTNQIAIYGTTIVPEFPIALMAFVVAFIPVIFFSRKIIKI